MSKSKFCGIIVNYHMSETTSILAKIFSNVSPNLGLIVVNNETQDWESARGKIHVINNSQNHGFAAAVNQGIKRAIALGGTKFLLLNPDLKINGKQIEELIKSDGDIVSPILKFTREKGAIFDFGGKVIWPIGRTVHLESNNLTTPSPGKIDYVSGACMSISKRVIDKIGYFDEQFFLYFEDVDYCLRAKKAGFTIRINQNVVVDHKISEHRYSNDLHKKRLVITSNLKFINKWVPFFFLPTAYIYLLFLKLRLAV